MKIIKSKLFWFLLLLVIVLIFFVIKNYKKIETETISVGILHSQTGHMAISESSIINAVLFAIQEINNSGGLLGKLIEPTILDGKSDATIFASQAEQLIKEYKVSVIFGCWTSSGRKAVKSVVEKNNNLLMYPVQYEGLEGSPNIIYSGAAPNQQIIPSVAWCLRHLGKKCYLVGSDYIYPRCANAVAKDYLTMLGGTVVGEKYQVLGSTNFIEIVDDIKKAEPDFIINTIDGQSNSAFFSLLNNAGITANKIPVMSYSISEAELVSTMNLNDLVGHYACWNYFSSIDTEINKKFIENFKNQYGSSRIINDPMETAYFNVHLWAKAVKRVGSTQPKKVIEALKGLGLYAPEGPVYIDSENQHAWRMSRIGKINKNGEFSIIWQSRKPIKPEPYPPTRSKDVWNKFTENLYKEWGNQWENRRK